MGRGAHHCLQRCSPQALLNSRDFHLEYSTSQDNISSSKVKLPRHLLPAAHYHCSPWASSFHAKASWLSSSKLQKNYLWQKKGKCSFASGVKSLLTLWPELIARSERVKQRRRDSKALSFGCQQAAEAAQPCCHATSGGSSTCCRTGDHSSDLKQMIPIKVLP